jgi:hypothetical protein
LPAATPHHPRQARPTPRLIAPVALALAALLATVPSTRAAQIDIPGPAGSNPFFPASGPATNSFNGLHLKSKFLALTIE